MQVFFDILFIGILVYFALHVTLMMTFRLTIVYIQEREHMMIASYVGNVMSEVKSLEDMILWRHLTILLLITKRDNHIKVHLKILGMKLKIHSFHS